MMQGWMVIKLLSFIQRIYMCSPYYSINIYVYKQPPCTPLSTSWPPLPPPLPTSALTWDFHHPPSLMPTTYHFQPISRSWTTTHKSRKWTPTLTRCCSCKPEDFIVVENVMIYATTRQPIAVSDISVYICLIDIRDGSCKPVYGGVDRLKALSSAKTGCRSRFFMN